MESRNTLIAWLNDAFAMEKALTSMLNNHAKDAESDPQVRQHIERHASVTQLQADRVEQCLSILGERPSSAKVAGGKFIAALQAPMTGSTSDELVKNALVDYATEHFEIACYRALIAAAEELGETEIAALCQTNLAEEEEMARWLEGQLPNTVRTYLHQAVNA